ncbi:MAG TPA: radical SAM protein [Pyrinomonadaceae bacterium]
MKITLVNVIEFEPIFEALKGGVERKSTNYPPIGLLTLAAVLEGRGYEVEVVDFGNLILNRTLTFDADFSAAAARYLKGRGGDVVGFSSRCDNYLFSLRIAEHFRRIEPETPIVFGGPQATITDVSSLENFDFITCVLRHETEFSLPALLETLKDARPFDDVPGLVYRRDGKVVKNPDPPLINDLDQIPMPAFRHFPIETLGAMPIEVGRGCPFGCTFCVTNRYFNQKYRLKSADRIIDEVLWLREHYGFRRFNFIHDMMTASRHLVMQLCERMRERDVHVEWTCSARTDCVDRELLEGMYAAGCRDIYFGIETGSQSLQKVVNKNLKLETAYEAVDLCSELGMGMVTSFITGFPEEREEDVEATLRMILELSPKASTVQLHLYSPTPGTPLNDKFSDRLIYTGYISDFGFATALSEEDEKVVVAHPDIFTNYFQVRPLYLDLDVLRGLDLFGYCLRSFKHFFFHVANEPEAPTLFEIWKGLRKWLDENGVVWELEKMMSKGLTRELEDYLTALLADSPRLPPVLFEAFNFDRALTHLAEATKHLPKDARAELRTLQPVESLAAIGPETRFSPRTRAVVTQTRCDFTRMMEGVTRRRHRPLRLSEQPTPVAIIPFRIGGGQSEKLNFTVVQLNEISEAVLRACQAPTSLRELVAGVAAHLNARGKQPPAHLEQLCLVAVKRLLAARAIQIDGRGEGETQTPARDLSLIFLEPLRPDDGRQLVGGGAAARAELPPPADWR